LVPRSGGAEKQFPIIERIILKLTGALSRPAYGQSIFSPGIEILDPMASGVEDKQVAEMILPGLCFQKEQGLFIGFNSDHEIFFEFEDNASIKGFGRIDDRPDAVPDLDFSFPTGRRILGRQRYSRSRKNDEKNQNRDLTSQYPDIRPPSRIPGRLLQH